MILLPATFATHICSWALSVLVSSSHPVTAVSLAVRVRAVPTLFRHTPPPVLMSPPYVLLPNPNFTETNLLIGWRNHRYQSRGSCNLLFGWILQLLRNSRLSDRWYALIPSFIGSVFDSPTSLRASRLLLPRLPRLHQQRPLQFLWPRLPRHERSV